MISSWNPSPIPFYGWRMVAVGVVVLFVSSGIGFYYNAVFLDPLQQMHGWSKGLLSAAVSLYFFVYGLMGVPIGRIVDRHGSRPVLVFGGVVFGLGLILLGQVNAFWQLIAVYLVLAVGFACTSLLPITTLITNWFIQRRGLAMSITMSGLSLGGIVIVPLSIFMLDRCGFQPTLWLLGLAFWVICLPVSLFFVIQRPEAVGQLPDGAKSRSSRQRPPLSLEQHATQYREWTRPQAARTRAFWAIVFAFLLALGAQMAFMIHQISFLGQYLGTARASLTISLASAASIAGRLLIGTIVDRVDKRLLTFLLLILQASIVLVLAYQHHPFLLYLGATIFGLTMGSILMLHSLITAECFGLVSYGTISGLSGLFINCGSAFGPMIAGFIYDWTQSYQIAFTLFAGASTMAAIIVIFARPPRRLPVS